MFLGVGIPWALAILPRRDWSQHGIVFAVGVALGPALTTTAMFGIATFGHLTLINVLAVSVLIAALGVVFARRQVPIPDADRVKAQPIHWIDGVLIFVIVVAVLLRFWNTAYWPFDNYDEFWVYGYNAKIFMLQRAIPASMGYYPQLLPLSMTYGQLAWGSLSEHAARTVVPYFGMGSILITYVLGAKLFSRRTGLIGAAVWALYAHHAGWAQYADLEVPVTIYFTGAAAFFISAWHTNNVRYALLGGIFAGAALWTKPTAGALIESILLIGGLVAVRYAMQGNRLAERIQRGVRAVIATPIPLFGLALLPMGGMWYVRNILFGHPPIVLPAGYWQAAAQRSGQELGWPLLVISFLIIYWIMRRRLTAVSQGGALAGFGLMLIGALPSVPNAEHLGIVQFGLIGAGGLLMIRSGWAWWRTLSNPTRTTILLLYGFIIPYFVTWFWSYSYHYRLSFAMVPLFTVQIGVLLDRFWTPILANKRARIALATAAILVSAIPGWVATLSAWGFALNGTLSDDHAKQAIANPALITLVDYLQAHRDPNDPSRPLHVEASGELRLPFFFPLDDMRTTDYPMQLDQIADVDYFVDSSVGQQLYLRNGIFYNQILSSLTRENVMTRQMTTDDHDFRFSVYTIHDAERFQPPKPNVPLKNVQIGDFARLVGWEITGQEQERGQPTFLTLYWQAIKPSLIDYSVYIHFVNVQTQQAGLVSGGEPVMGAYSLWQNVPGAHFDVPYHTRLWQAGEYIKDELRLRLPPDMPLGDYDLTIGLFDPIGGQRLTVFMNGKAAGDGLHLTNFQVDPARTK